MEEETHKYGRGNAQVWKRKHTGMEEEKHRHGTGNTQVWKRKHTGMEEEKHRYGRGNAQAWKRKNTGMEEEKHRYGRGNAQVWKRKHTGMEEETHRHGRGNTQVWRIDSLSIKKLPSNFPIETVRKNELFQVTNQPLCHRPKTHKWQGDQVNTDSTCDRICSTKTAACQDVMNKKSPGSLQQTNWPLMINQ